MRKRFFTLLALPLALAACSAKKVYPDPDIGWHNASHTVLFGRLERLPSRNPENPPVWAIRYDNARDQFGGEFALTPPERLTGYAGGETVEIRGTPRPDLAHPDYTGTWYEVRGIRMWSGHR